jgi:putative endonuclease
MFAGYTDTMNHYVYIVRCADGTLYTGYTTDISKRVREHNGAPNSKAGARYTRGRRPVTLVYQESYSSRSEALSREAAIKQLTRSEKETLLTGATGFELNQ